MAKAGGYLPTAPTSLIFPLSTRLGTEWSVFGRYIIVLEKTSQRGMIALTFSFFNAILVYKFRDVATLLLSCPYDTQ